jgi:hypothetical protein
MPGVLVRGDERVGRGCLVSVTDELTQLGHLGGPGTMAMLTSRWRSAVKPMYVLEPAGGWSPAAREDLLHDFLAEKLEDLTDAVVAVRDDAVAVVKVTSRIMRHWLIDKARKSDAGAVRLRLEELLRGDPMFVQPDGHRTRWALAGSEAIRDADIETLLEAAEAVPGIRPVRWKDPNRRPPMASGPDLVRVLHAVLECAGGSVETATLVAVFHRRFAVTMTTLVPLEDDDTLGDRLAAPPTITSVGLDDAATRAAQVYAQLSDREQRTLLHLDDHHAVQAELGVGRSIAYTVIGRVRAALQALAGEDVDHVAVVAALVRLAETDAAARRAAASDHGTVPTSESPVTTDAEGGQQ